MNASLESRYREVTARISSARALLPATSRPVTLVAVSKLQSTEAILELYRLGQRDFGENYVQELAQKARELEDRGIGDIRWHFIGHLQTNKVKQLLPLVSMIHSIDSEKLAAEVAKRWRSIGRPGRIPVFIAVNIDEEESKSGVSVMDCRELCEKVATLQEIDLRGLMAIPRPESAQTGIAFKRLRELDLQCRPFTKGELSMGMTQDFEIAIREGATHVRVGSALFGPRI